MGGVMSQNTSHAVMAQRKEPTDSLDFFPTPPWATRALMEHGIYKEFYQDEVCLEPAAGQGHMSGVLGEYFDTVIARDIHDYGAGIETRDFLDDGTLFESQQDSVDWVITNPPFNLAIDFVKRGLAIAQVGVAVLVRTNWAEGVARYKELFDLSPPYYWAVFTERVPMHKGRVDPKGSTATSYSWAIWLKRYATFNTRLIWIPPCRKELERPEDYREAS